ncbi:MAG: hypothetical protein A3I39_03315 [Candidatus Yanofskybacteria bacterium RIFCSPLOWO2_02_FULL_47_9b]|uniref:Predicted 3'-5' exonuclease PolB-like domain-containing protein n=1 Tax=Candidatus Yanofskybacteria bacterium RIFCSPLOWO2_02_FULL_47_9b TaxID=1802708 RepID=A0A1F8HCW3_9BACT|nr:MAG: hypothetical protein A3I39_03315 [Candidatus Yanofskybacteria bacterium RIFCSPLOWO2_02_FULL_47_9b]
MPRLIFDIETVGAMDFEKLDKKSQELLLDSCETDEERQLAREGMGLSPLTGRVAAIAILNPETNKGAVYYQKQNDEVEEEIDGNTLIPCTDEKEILKKFWEIAPHYDQLVTFNGHSFDCPFVMIRSAILKIKATVPLMGYRFGDRPHLDIYDKLTNYGAVRFKRSLHLWCQAFGIESPKDKGIDGYEVAEYFKNKKCREIALYCFADIKATATLLDYWEKYLAGK